MLYRHDDDGTITIFGEGLESRDKAVSLIEGITAEAEVGQIYTGKVTKSPTLAHS